MTVGQRWAFGILVAAVLLVVVPLAVDRVSSREPLQSPELAVHVVVPGDKLWDIARRYYPERDPREVVWAIRRLNPDVDPGRLQPRRVLVLPWGGPRHAEPVEVKGP